MSARQRLIAKKNSARAELRAIRARIIENSAQAARARLADPDEVMRIEADRDTERARLEGLRCAALDRLEAAESQLSELSSGVKDAVTGRAVALALQARAVSRPPTSEENLTLHMAMHVLQDEAQWLWPEQIERNRSTLLERIRRTLHRERAVDGAQALAARRS